MSKNGNSCRAHRAYGDRWEGGTKGLEPTSRALLLLSIRFGDARRPARRRFSNFSKLESLESRHCLGGGGSSLHSGIEFGRSRTG